MDLSWDPSVWDNFFGPSGRITVFESLLEKTSQRREKGVHILNASYYAHHDKRNDFVEQIQSMVIHVFGGYFRRNKWFQQSICIADDIAYVLEWDDSLLRQMVELLDDELEKRLHVAHCGWKKVSIDDIPQLFGLNDLPESQDELESILRHYTLVYGMNSMSDIYVTLNLPQSEIRRSVDAVLDKLRHHNQWLDSELDSQWRIESRLRSPRLPPEICRLVIESLTVIKHWDEYDPKPLASWCLTCRYFVNESRKHLYNSIVFRDHLHIQRFFKSLSRWSYLQGLTTSLNITSKDVRTYHEFFLRGQPLLPSLEGVYLDQMPPLHPSLHILHRPFHTVRSLVFYSGTFASVLDLRRLLDNFLPNISDLFLQPSISFYSPHISLPQNIIVEKTLAISNLVLHNGGSMNDVPPSFYTWLFRTRTPSTILSLFTSASELDRIMLSPLCQQLELLDIYWGYRLIELDKNTSFGADIFPSLKTLVTSDFNMPQNIQTFCDMISKSHRFSSSLSCIRLWLPQFQMEEQEYRELDDTLSTQIPLGVWIEIEEKYWEHLPKLRSKGVLDVPTESKYIESE